MSKFRTYTFMTDKKSSNNEENDEIYEPVRIDDDLPLTVVDITVKAAEIKSAVPRHWHRSLEILLPESGGAIIYENGKERTVYPNDFVLINSTSVHALSSTNPEYVYHGFAIQISYSYLCEMIENFEEISFALEYDEADRKKMTEYLQQLVKAYDSNLLNRRLLILAALNNFLVTLCDKYIVQRENQIIRNAKDLVTNTMHYMAIHVSEVFDAQKTAEAMNVSYGYLSRKFKEVSGFSMGAYATRIRMQRAEKVLLRSKQSIFDVSDSCGFANVKSFEREFKKIHKMNPSKWKQEYQKLDFDE